MRQHFFRNEQGFSLAELMVSVAIMSIILTVILMGQSRYTARASLNANINEVALTVRQAQTYGISVRDVSPGLQEFNAGYGVSFRIASSAGSNEYIYYADRGTSDLQKYTTGSWSTCNPGGSSECLAKTTLTGGNLITEICYKQTTSSSVTCGTSSTNNRRVDITFTRPETGTSIKVFSSSGGSEVVVSEYVRIRFTSPTGINKWLRVYPTGQISIRDAA